MCSILYFISVHLEAIYQGRPILLRITVHLFVVPLQDFYCQTRTHGGRKGLKFLILVGGP